MSIGYSNARTQREQNARVLQRECEWLSRVIELRFSSYFKQSAELVLVDVAHAPELDATHSAYAKLVAELGLGIEARLMLVLSLVPALKPQLLDVLFIKNKNLDRSYTEFGGQYDQRGGFLPTLETAFFILAGDDLQKRFELMAMFDQDHPLISNRILDSSVFAREGVLLNTLLTPTMSTINKLTTGVSYKPRYDSGFRASLITTTLGWDDLVLNTEGSAQISDITAWLKHREKLLNDWGLDKRIKPGYRSLFHGPSGTGKALAAMLIGKQSQHDVYRVDTPALVSRYIGETGKNVSNLFDQAEGNQWILFFDEADALFGRRTSVKDSHDRYANIEVSYLLQRIEAHSGIVILSTSLTGELDDAFIRRFQSVIHFPMPDADQRLTLWRTIIGDKLSVDDDVELSELASQYELAGEAIANVVRYAATVAAKEHRNTLGRTDLIQGIRNEFARKDWQKEG